MPLTAGTSGSASTWERIMSDPPQCETCQWFTLNFNSRTPRDDSIECCSRCLNIRTTRPLMSYG